MKTSSVSVCQLAYLPRHRIFGKGGNSDGMVTVHRPQSLIALLVGFVFLSLWPSNTLLFTLVKSFQPTRSSQTNCMTCYENATFIKFWKRDSRKILKQEKIRNNMWNYSSLTLCALNAAFTLDMQLTLFAKNINSQIVI